LIDKTFSSQYSSAGSPLLSAFTLYLKINFSLAYTPPIMPSLISLSVGKNCDKLALIPVL
jgi:hypothetical protein